MRIVICFLLLGIVAAHECIYSRAQSFSSDNVVREFWIEHNYGDSTQVKLFKGDQFRVVVTSTEDDPLLLRPSNLNMVFSELDEVANLVTVI